MAGPVKKPAGNMRLTGDDFIALASEEQKPVKLGYIFREGVHSLSYSRLNTFYSCPRKFHLGEIKGARGFAPTIHTAFGHAYGAGVQEYLRLRSDGMEQQLAQKRAVVHAIAAYDYPDIFEEMTKAKKGLWYAVLAVEKFCQQVAEQILGEFKVATINGKPAIELFFLLEISEEYDYQGHIDLVLEQRETGELFVFEIKTGMQETHPADWQNSSQTLGYNVILHAAHPGRSNYNVLYMHYNTAQLEHRLMSFSKSSAHRAGWITSLLQDVQQMDMYRAAEHWPKRGNNCNSWNKPCYLFGVCDSPVAAAPEVSSYEALAVEDADIVLQLVTLLQDEESTVLHALDASEDVIDWDAVNVPQEPDGEQHEV